MKISTSMDKRHVRTMSHNMWITFYYDSDEYKEILNNQAFTANDLWSQIGGIVGIMLGFSFLQVPQILQVNQSGFQVLQVITVQVLYVLQEHQVLQVL
mgnify:CR=1 FL=1